MTRRRTPSPRPAALAGGLAALVLTALPAGAQTPAAPLAAPKPGPVQAAAAAVPSPALAAPPPHWRRPLRPLPGAGAVRTANAEARSFPTPDAYVNATLYYDYEAGRLYQVQTSPHFLTAILLRPGEKLLAKAAGDTVRWVLGETAQGAGVNQQVVVLLKPIRGGLKTNVVLTTDQRTYLIEASSREGGTYTLSLIHI